MTLDQAIDLLIKVHTEDDPVTGFRILVGADPHTRFFGPVENYTEAWRVVREHNKFRTEPGYRARHSFGTHSH